MTHKGCNSCTHNHENRCGRAYNQPIDPHWGVCDEWKPTMVLKVKYAVIQLGYCIFGMGETEDLAIEEASKWLDNHETGYQGGLTKEQVKAELFDGDWRYAVDGDLIITDDEALISRYEE